MPSWTGSWIFKQPESPYYGRTGNETVDAEDRREAKVAIKCSASRELFGNPNMQSHVEVTDMKEVLV